MPVTSGAGPEPKMNSQRPVKVFRVRWGDRVGNVVFRGLSRRGFGPASLLTTTGRRSGQERCTPVIPVVQDNRTWLVAPYGDVAWVRNARASGHVSLRRGRFEHGYEIRDVIAAEAGPIVKQYVDEASAPRPYFRAAVGAPTSEFEAGVDLHPVFELTEVDPTGTGSGVRHQHDRSPALTVGASTAIGVAIGTAMFSATHAEGW